MRVAAWQALGELAPPAAVPALLAALANAEEAERDTVVRALRGIRGKEAVETMVEAARNAAPATLAPLLSALSWHVHPDVAPLLLAGARHADTAVRAAALDGLARVKDARAVPHIIAAASQQDAVRAAAVRAALHYVDDLVEADKAAAATLFTAALDRTLVPDTEDRKRALRGLAFVGGPGIVDKLNRDLNASLGADTAYAAAFAIAERLAKEGKRDQAIALYTKTMRHRGHDPRRIRKAQDALRKLGVAGDLAQRAGFVTRWWVCGPFPNPKNTLFDKELPPEKGKVDLTKPVAAEGRTCTWKHVHTANHAGIVNLEKALGKDDRAAALLYAEVTVARPVSIYLRLGYDDDCVGYVNGRRVHHHQGRRGLHVDEWRGDTALKPGVNTILLKVLNRGPRWAVCARLMQRNDIAIDFAQREK